MCSKIPELHQFLKEVTTTNLEIEKESESGKCQSIVLKQLLTLFLPSLPKY